MIRALVDFALNNRFVVIAIALLLIFWGAISFHNLPVEAYPDIADNYVTVITQWPGRSAEEIEQQVTIPIEVQMAGMPHMTFLRSESIFGLSYVIMIFDDSSVNDWNRQKVLERLTQVNLPNGQNLQPQIGTDWSTTGQIYWYTIRSTDPRYDLMQLRSIEDWVLLKEFKSVLNVVDVSDFGGTVREYQVRVDPNRLVSYGLSIGQVEQQLSNNNNNAGGSFVELGQQQMNVRALGLYRSVQDIENTVLVTKGGTALRVKDIADVQQGPMIRLGHMARANHMPDGTILDEPDVIQGGVLMRKGAEEQPTLDAIHKKVDELNNGILPAGVKVVPMLDRSDLLHFTLHTVMHNLTEGMILVTIILLLFLLNARAAFIVALMEQGRGQIVMKNTRIGMALDTILENFNGLLRLAFGIESQGTSTGCTDQSRIKPQSLMELGKSRIGIALLEQCLAQYLMADGAVLALQRQPIFRNRLIVVLLGERLVPGLGV